MYDSIEIGRSATALHLRAAFLEPPEDRRARRAPRSTAASALPRGFHGDLGAVRPLDDRTLLLGLGREADLTAAALRTAGARLVRGLEALGVDAIRIDAEFGRGAALAALGDRVAGRALGDGMAVGTWRVDGFDGTATNRSPRLPRLRVHAAEPELLEGLQRGLGLGRAVNAARRIGAMPPNLCTPQRIADEARRLARRTGMRFRAIALAEARRLGMGGLVAVGAGSDHPPAIVILEHRPKRVAREAKGRRIVLVGKTITFDTGGYSLKLDKSMRWMKYDKCGGAAVLGAMQAIAEAELPVEVIGLLPTAENMISGGAYRVDDILTMHNGVTVEVSNTDAEGRLVLADALSWACSRLRPTEILDIATLTGGVVVALGSVGAGLFCEEEGLRTRVLAASRRSGERLWHLPIWPEHREMMRSQHADIVNSNPRREALPIQGAAFLSYFVDPAIPWAHIDIAGVAAVESGGDGLAPGPTGFGVRLLYDYVESVAGVEASAASPQVA
ncbi:MAG TPA: leucyl aminopeptidase family protein [Phycisphaerales bacterium]|nr:leucyl aminopeptidase family protein [Phycisphaerales bacterium]HMP37156.1 leucyl aminopeptidase family protein [Phycisphaerales bacterium]